MLRLNTPLKEKDTRNLKLGDIIYLTGEIFTARDSVYQLVQEGGDLPFDPTGMAIYHCGPLMWKKGGKWKPVAAGPTTSGRMDSYEKSFLEKYDVKAIIGKGGMGKEISSVLQDRAAVYLSYTGGCGALAADKIKEVKDVYWLEEMGMANAIWHFEVEELGPLVVSMDSKGGNIQTKIQEKAMEKFSEICKNQR